MAIIDEFKIYKNIHMIGIGGVSMSGIAEILKFWGFNVTGSDCNASDTTEKLIKNGIKVTIGHNLEDVSKADIVIYSAAIRKTDVELVKAQELNIPVIDRGTFLGKLTKAFQDSICISGTHGKTTTTSMISLCFLEAHKDPSVQVGAYLKQIDGNYRVGNSEYFIVEACEYVESYLKLFPKTEVILNIDNDHLDYFGTFDNIVNSFDKYVKLLPENGLLVLNWDDINCRKIAKDSKSRIVTYALESENANFIARNITFNSEGFASFDVYYNNSFYKTIKLSVPGMHNVMNALACIAVCHSYGISKEDIKNALAKYTGAHRRFEYVGSFNQGVSVYDDYGHHPTEILATAHSVAQKQHRQSWVVFQPHTYSRTKNLLDDFAKALLNFDNVIITDIYAAREDNVFGISSKDLVDRLQHYGKKSVYISDFNDIVKYLKDYTIKNDIVLTLGAGTVTNIGPMLVN
ncbi:MAG: UDP-N-acetylmuramate--L-alanine ligase [Clostridia bacterium]